MNNFLLPIRYYAYSAFWIIAGCQTAHLIYRPMKELEDLHTQKVELYQQNIEAIHQLQMRIDEHNEQSKNQIQTPKPNPVRTDQPNALVSN